MWDLIVSVPDHCLSFYFERNTIDLFVKTKLIAIAVFPHQKCGYMCVEKYV